MIFELLLFAFVFALLYHIITIFFPQPSGKSAKTLSKMKSMLSVSEKLYIGILKPLAKAVATMVPIDEYTRQRVKKNLDRVGIDLTAKEYYAKAFITAFLIAVSGIVLHLLLRSIPITLCALFLAIMMFFRELQGVDGKIEKLNNEIYKELPNFVITFADSLQGTRDIEKIISRYRKICGDAFRYDLDVLLSELKHGEHEAALRNLDDRLNLPYVTSFVNSVINVEKGGSSETETMMFRLQVESMNELQKANLRKEFEARPGKIRRAIYAIGIMVLLIIMIPIFLDLKISLGVFD